MEDKPQQEQIQQETIALTGQLVNDLVQLLANNNPQVQHGTISAILQYTPTSEARLMFVGTNLIPLLRKYVFAPKLTTISLSTLIHFATESDFLPQCFPLIEPLILQMKEWKGLELELSLLLVLNISKQEEIIARIIGQEDKRGYLIEILYTLLEKQIKVKWIVGNILVNLASIERGRKFMVEDKVYKRFISLVVSFDFKIRESALKILRNCAFQWEDEAFALEILKEQYNLLNHIGKLISYLLKRKELVSDPLLLEPLANHYFTQNEYSLWTKYFQIQDKAKTLAEIQTAIDIVLILSNADFRSKKTGVNIRAFRQLLTALKYTGIEQATKDKLQALQIFGF